MDNKRPGRPKSDNPRSYLVPNRMTREEQRMLRLKAALYTGGNTSELIRQAVGQFSRNKTIPCTECNGVMHLVPAKDRITIDIAGSKHEVLLHDMPVYECANCHVQEYDLSFAAEVESVVDEEIGFSLQNRQPLPTEINFNDLIRA